MKPREFHIWEFPADKIRILFKNHSEFIDKAIEFFGSKKALANFLGVSAPLIYYWKKYPLHMPFSSVKKIVDKLKLDWNRIEKQIVSYKGVNLSSPIVNPKLPIKETPEIFALIAHIVCDGCVNKKGIPYYINSNEDLINNFDKMLRNNFGKIPSKKYFGGGINKNCYEYRFPKIITELLEYFYDIKLYKAENLPKEIFNLPKEFVIFTIRAFVDDEGSVDMGGRIGIYSTNKKILEVLIKLLKEKLSFDNVTNVLKKGEKYYYFYIKTGDAEKYYKEVGFNHSSKKQKLKELIDLRKSGKRVGQRMKTDETRERLLKLLDNNVLSTNQIIKELKIGKSNVNMQLKRLLKENLIVQSHKIGQTIFWTRSK